jgi:hypothetical protein
VVSIPRCGRGDPGSNPGRGIVSNSSKWQAVNFFERETNQSAGYRFGTFRDAMTSSIGGSVVEFSPATREARVRFPADAFLLLPFSNNDWGSWIKQTIVRSPRMVRWCSGYHICLTRRRSPVRSRPESSNIFVQNGVQKVIRI